MIKKIQEIIFQEVVNILREHNIEKEILKEQIKVEKIQNIDFGDYSTNILMVLKEYPNLKEWLIDKLDQNNYIKNHIKKIEYKEPGFLNFYFTTEVLIDNLEKIVDFNIDNFKIDNPKKFLIEHTSPNTNKALHIGHLRNSIFAMSVVKILKTLNHTVLTDCLFNDRGVHICKAMFGYLKYNGEKSVEELLNEWFKNSEKWPQPEDKEPQDIFVGKFYLLGVKQEEENKEEIQWLLQEWENGNDKVMKLWEKLNNWFYNGFYTVFKTIGSYSDHYWKESEFYKQGKDLIQQGLSKGVFVKLDDGAILTNLEKYNLTDTIVQRSDGTAMYFTQDLYLTKMKTEMFPSDIYIWVVGPEQKLHMQQVFAVCEQLNIGDISKFKHLSYGAVCNKDGSKMSSRSGEVLNINELIDAVKNMIVGKISEEYKSLGGFEENERKEIIEKIAIGAIKYSILRLERDQDLKFDMNAAVDLKGNGSPYIQYTYARCNSILEKIKEITINNTWKIEEITQEEIILLRDLIFLNETVEKSGNTLSPHLIANYIFELARDFSNFYEKNRIMDATVNQKLKIDLTQAVANVLKFGLELLGIEVVNKL